MTSLGDTGRKTGFWLEEFAAPYYVFRDAGVELTLASPKGGQPPIDPKSDLPENQTPAMARFKQDPVAQDALAHTVKLKDMRSENFDAIFYSGGHGPMWDLVDNPDSIALDRILLQFGQARRGRLPCTWRAASGDVSGRADREGQARHRLCQQRGGGGSTDPCRAVSGRGRAEAARRICTRRLPDWQSFAITDGRLITGQNPASSTAGAQALLNLLSDMWLYARESSAA